MNYKTLVIEQHGRVCLIKLNRPDALNAINQPLTADLIDAVEAADIDPNVGCIVVAGSEKAFAAGADIKEMEPRSFVQMFEDEWFGQWERFSATRTPMIAAVAGYALGGGCELAMMCDIIIAADTAKFGQPEIKLGVTPGMGGTQRLTRAIGKSKAMELCLTGRMMDAAEAERSGLVSRVVPTADLMVEVMKVATTIAEMSLPSAMMTKEAINRSYEGSLSEGIRFERRMFHALFATADQKEGMAAFSEKRRPKFVHR